MCYSLWYNARCCRPATSWVHYTTSCNTQSSVPEDGRDHRPQHVEPIRIINKPLSLHLVGIYIIGTRILHEILFLCLTVPSMLSRILIKLY